MDQQINDEYELWYAYGMMKKQHRRFFGFENNTALVFIQFLGFGFAYYKKEV